MYWNAATLHCSCKISLLNSNIRCIEIPFDTYDCEDVIGWIVTLDVLKSMTLEWRQYANLVE